MLARMLTAGGWHELHKAEPRHCAWWGGPDPTSGAAEHSIHTHWYTPRYMRTWDDNLRNLVSMPSNLGPRLTFRSLISINDQTSSYLKKLIVPFYLR